MRTRRTSANDLALLGPGTVQRDLIPRNLDRALIQAGEFSTSPVGLELDREERMVTGIPAKTRVGVRHGWLGTTPRPH
jgi:hypothetical protein